MRPSCRNAANDKDKDVVWNGKTIDVKCAKQRAPFGLMVGSWKKKNPADIYALRILDKDGRTLTLAGCALATNVLNERYSRRLYGKEWYTVPLNQLCKRFDKLREPISPQYFFDENLMCKI